MKATIAEPVHVHRLGEEQRGQLINGVREKLGENGAWEYTWNGQ